MTNTSIHSIGIIGAGKLGIVLAQLSLKAGYKVFISGSGDPQKIALSIAVLAPGASAMTSEQVAHKADLVILALPLGRYRELPRDALAGKLIVDAMNYWWEVDGVRDDLNDPTTSSSEIVREYLAAPRFVKALNHMGYHHLHDETAPANAPRRKAIAIAGDSEQDTRIIGNYTDSIGFDPVYAGRLDMGIRLQPGSEIFGAHVQKNKLQSLLDRFPSTPRGKEIEMARASNRIKPQER